MRALMQNSKKKRESKFEANGRKEKRLPVTLRLGAGRTHRESGDCWAAAGALLDPAGRPNGLSRVVPPVTLVPQRVRQHTFRASQAACRDRRERSGCHFRLLLLRC